MPEDRSLVIKARTDALSPARRMPRSTWRTIQDRRVTLSYIDATHRHGVYVGLFEVEGSTDLIAGIPDHPDLPGRRSRSYGKTNGADPAD